MHKNLFFAVLLVSILFIFFAVRVNSDINADLIAIDKATIRLMKQYQVPGVSLAVIDKGRVIWLKGYGWADKEGQIEVNNGTRFQVASNSKTLAAWGIMRLVDEGKLDLDAPVGKYLKRWQLPASRYDANQVTIRRILSHTAGLSISSYPGYAPGVQLPTLEQSLSGISTGLESLKIKFAPGKKYRYSGGGYTLLQLVIEEISGQPFPVYMQNRVLDPLGMVNSSYEPEPAEKNNTAIGYDIGGKKLPRYQFTEKAAAGLYTTAIDMARFVIANMDTGEGQRGKGILTPQSLDAMQTPVKKDYGFACLIKYLKDRTRIIYHGGTNRGWRAQYVILPEKQKGIVILTNSDRGKDLYQDLIRFWIKRETGFIPAFLKTAVLLRSIVFAVTVLGAVILILLLIFFFRKTGKGKRQFLFSSAAYNRRALILVAVKACAAILLAVIWHILFYTGIPYHGWIIASTLPYGFDLVSLLFYLWCLACVVFFLFPAKPRAALDKNAGKSGN